MTELDDTMPTEIKDLIDELGKPIDFEVYSTPATYSPASGKKTGGVSSTVTVTCSPPSRYALHFVDGDLIQNGDVKLIVPAKDLTFTPTPAMQVTFDSEVWKIVRVEPIYVGETIGAYKAQLRR